MAKDLCEPHVHNVYKALQRRFLTFISTKYGIGVCLLSLALVFDVTIHVTNLVSSSVGGSEYVDNLAGKSFKDTLCSDDIDVVYTWVNGSDMGHRRVMERLKRHLLRGSEGVHNTTDDQSNELESSDTADASRFQDNDELRYSMRSLEKYAPWIRHVYIVTNGQIPSWLDLSHPKVTIVQHHEIFSNLSHLPTFSSPAIETHIHKIPGLSERFLYFNDDTLLGSPVFPDDFHTASKGQKVFLSWPVPYCSEGCAPSWVGDGYCDTACNNSVCDWDGGDCANVTASSRYRSWYNQGSSYRGGYSSYKSRTSKYCSPGCPDSWVGDRFCDRACKNVECGWDAGDCGKEVIFDLVFGLNVTWATSFVEIPPHTPSMYIGLQDIFPSDTKIKDGSHDCEEMVRTATISQKLKLMTLTFHRNISRKTVGIFVSGEVNGTLVQKEFNISVITKIDVAPSQEYVIDSTNFTAVSANRTESAITTTTVEEKEEELLSIEETNTNTNTDDSNELSVEGANESDDDSSSEDEEDSQTTRRRILSVTVLDDFEPLIRDPSFPHGIGRTLQSIPEIEDEDLLLEMIMNTKKKDLVFDRDIEARSKMEDLPFDPVRPLNGYVGRRLLDIFGDSLKHVNKLYNREFGSSSRKVPAHMPHFLQKSILYKLHSRWPNEFEETSSHQFRASNDMQFAFSYFYFLMDQKLNGSVDDVFGEFDLNGDGVLDIRELRTMMLFANPTFSSSWAVDVLSELTQSNVSNTIELEQNETPASPGNEAEQRAYEALSIGTPNNSSEHEQDPSSGSDTSRRLLWRYNDNGPDPVAASVSTVIDSGFHDVQITKEELAERGGSFLTKLQRRSAGKSVFKSESVDTDDVGFMMVGSNGDDVLRALDKMRRDQKKFLCLNDNMNHSDPNIQLTVNHLREFFLSYFPEPSSFELVHHHNEFLWMDDYVVHRQWVKVLWVTSVVGITAITTALFWLYRKGNITVFLRSSEQRGYSSRGNGRVSSWWFSKRFKVENRRRRLIDV